MHKRAYRLYRSTAFVTLNALALFVLLNVGIGIAFLVRDGMRTDRTVDRRLSAYREKFADLDAYAVLSKAEANAFLDEQDLKGTLGLQFDPWLQFREPSFRGRLLNTNEQGFRVTRPPSRTQGQKLSVFVFGGSTTFGYGVPDNFTIPSYLQSILDEQYPSRAVRVHNFGQAYYYSSQLLVLFLQLIKAGQIPDYAVFIDGGNDMAQLGRLRDEPTFTPTVASMWRRRNEPPPRMGGLDWLPVVRATTGAARRLGLIKESAASEQQHRLVRAEDTDTVKSGERARFVVSRYTDNLRMRRAICREYGVRCLFVWQPHVAHAYDRTLHRRFPFQDTIPSFYHEVVLRMEAFSAPDYLYLGGLLKDVREKVYVDDVHYNEKVNSRIADLIASKLHTLDAGIRVAATRQRN